MKIFEDDASQDDFEVEITDLPASDEVSRFPAAIAALRSRISLRARSEESDDEVGEDDFEVEVTDLPANEKESGNSAAPAVLGALRTRLPRRSGAPGLPLGGYPIWRLAMLGIAILLMLAVTLGSVPAVRDRVFSLFAWQTPTPTPDSTTRASTRFWSPAYSSTMVIIPANSGIEISSTPIAGATVTPWSPGARVSDVLGRVPQDCPFDNVPQDEDSQFADFPYGTNVGAPPLWVIGFEGTPAKLVDFTRANPAQYGWVRQITLVLQGNNDGPVMLQGGLLPDETPILFGDPDAGQNPSTLLALKLDTSSPSDPRLSGTRWGMRAVSLYIPAAGCYYLKASWAGGSWEVIFAAGE